MVSITDQHKLGARRQRLQQVARQEHIQHAGLINHQSINRQGIARSVSEAMLIRIIGQQTMNGGSFSPGHLLQPLGGSSSGTGQRNLAPQAGTGLSKGPNYSGLAGAGAAGNNAEARAKRFLERVLLLFGQR